MAREDILREGLDFTVHELSACVYVGTVSGLSAALWREASGASAV